MYIGDGTLYFLGALISIALIFTMIRSKNHKSPTWCVHSILFAGGVTFYLCYYFVPFPLDATGLDVIGDNVIRFQDAVAVIPFQTMIVAIKHAELPAYLFEHVLVLLAGALLGYALPMIIQRCRNRKNILAVGLALLFGPAAIVLLFKAFTGYFIRELDITNLFLFGMMYAVGSWIGFKVRICHEKFMTSLDEIVEKKEKTDASEIGELL